MQDSKNRVTELLFRDEKSVVSSAAKEFYRGKTILVTGGGGTIGGELSRMLSSLSPKKLIIFDIYENNAYEIFSELQHALGEANPSVVEIGSVRDRARLDEVFSEYKPQIVFHAAAHKHVPLMEHNAIEAIKNNVLGTYNTADMAEKHGAEKFVLISTDKAVNPTSVMGATKRICEHIVSCRADGETTFCSVRFGNVLGSAGSVVPIFRRQIENGGPLTVTDKRIVRYFMSVREAAELLLETGAMARGGELFILDMGSAVKIVDLAEKMIERYSPDREIEIREVGLRPGERLYEELLYSPSKCLKTTSNKIYIERDLPKTREEMEGIIDIFRDFLINYPEKCNTNDLKRIIGDILSEYSPQ